MYSQFMMHGQENIKSLELVKYSRNIRAVYTCSRSVTYYNT